MHIRRAISLALAAAALTSAIAVPAASASSPIDAPSGSVLDVLEQDGTAFDSNWYDFDILEAVARTVVDAKGVNGTLVAQLANPDAQLTVFAPNDRAFQVLAWDLTGKWYGTEAGVVGGIVDAIQNKLHANVADTLEAVLLYHVVAGKVPFSVAKTITTPVATVLGPTITPRYYRWINTLVLVDQDRDDLNPWVVNSKRDIQTANGKSIIHGISLVLRPINLP
jgi:uncharacterized surface protein with fasciclin (FAS1) repeats